MACANILHLSYGLNYGGVESIIQNICDNRHKSIYNHEFAAIMVGGVTERYLRQAGCEVFILRDKGRFYSPSAARALADLCATRSISLIHARGIEANIVALVYRAFGGRVPVIAEEIGVPDHSIRARFLMRFLYRKSAKVVGISPAVEQFLVSSREASSSQIVSISNPVKFPDPDHSSSPGCFNAVRIQVAVVGRLAKKKNVDSIIEAAWKLRSIGESVLWHVVGDGPEKARLQELVSSYDLDENVLFHGYQADPFSFVENCSVFLQPSEEEGSSLALLEAIGCCKFVIATQTGDASLNIVNGENGFLLSDSSSAEIVKSMLRAIDLGNAELRNRATARRDAVVAKYSCSLYMLNIDSLYSQEIFSFGVS